jgi:hypothetical protein
MMSGSLAEFRYGDGASGFRKPEGLIFDDDVDPDIERLDHHPNDHAPESV